MILSLFNERTLPVGENSCKRSYFIDGTHTGSMENFNILDLHTRCPKRLYIILKLSFRAVHFSITKMFVLSDSRDIYESFGTLSVSFNALINY